MASEIASGLPLGAAGEAVEHRGPRLGWARAKCIHSLCNNFGSIAMFVAALLESLI